MQAADLRDGLGCPCAELRRYEVITDAAQYVGHRPLMPTVENAAQLLILLRERVGFVNQQCRMPTLDGSKECCRRHVGRRERLRHDHIQQPERGDERRELSPESRAQTQAWPR